MSTQKVGILAIKADEQRAELVNPGETAFIDEPLPIKLSVEQPFTPTLGCFAVAFVLGDVGNHAMIEAHFTPIPGIEGTVGVEQRPGNAQVQTFESLEGGLKMPLQTKGIMVIARHQTRRGDHKTIGIGDEQEVTGLGAFSRLVSHTFAGERGMMWRSRAIWIV